MAAGVNVPCSWSSAIARIPSDKDDEPVHDRLALRRTIVEMRTERERLLCAPKKRTVVHAIVVPPTKDQPEGPPPDAGYVPAKEIECIFNMSPKERATFLANHQAEIRTTRPKTQKGKPDEHRLLISLIDFCRAIGRDDYWANNPLVLEKIQRNLNNAKTNRKMADACEALLATLARK